MVKRRAVSIRLRIVTWAVVVVALAMGLGSVAVVWSLDRIIEAEVVAQLEDEIDALSGGDGDTGDDDTEDGRSEAPQRVENRDDDVLVVWRDGETVTLNDEDAAALPADEGTHRITIDGEPFLAITQNADGGTLSVARSIEDSMAAIAAAAVVLLVAVPLAVAMVGAVVWVVVTRALAPVERIRKQVDSIDARALNRRVPVSGAGDEIDRLAGTMNGMLQRVESGYQARRQFVSDASHELRSPLATMRQYAELADSHPEITSAAELSQVVRAEGERMSDIVERLLLLARLDENPVLVAADVDLDDLALAEVTRVRRLGERSVDGHGIAPVQVRGDQRLIARALRNLVDNAVRHAQSTVSIGCRVVGDQAVMWVDDDGAGISDKDQERVFERFTRLDEARSRDAGGSGLGLAIVREVALAHGGAARVETSPAGGARFVMVFRAG